MNSRLTQRYTDLPQQLIMKRHTYGHPILTLQAGFGHVELRTPSGERTANQRGCRDVKSHTVAPGGLAIPPRPHLLKANTVRERRRPTARSHVGDASLVVHHG
ncbi:hypothetical protein Bbelb_124690 [Branchiostoma belcheri]|nr:hypothetical protein Bbelb_124690 [Branchiostoma belcheri]